MSDKPADRTLRSLEQAVAYAKGKPEEGTRERWFDAMENKYQSRTFRDGKWVMDE